MQRDRGAARADGDRGGARERGVALFEYLLQVPAIRADYGQFDLGQLKVMLEIIALTVFVPFALYYMKEPLSSISCGRGCASSAQRTSCSGRRQLPDRRTTWAVDSDGPCSNRATDMAQLRSRGIRQEMARFFVR